MEFRTELFVKSGQNMGLSDNVVTIGSCFADDIGEKLVQNKFKVLKNPFGTVYNPVSIHRLLICAIDQVSPTGQGFLERDGSYYHHDFHSEWNSLSTELLKQNLESQINIVHRSLSECRVLIITYGTAWVYENRKTKSIVANCHKVPQQNFEKFLLTQKRIVESFEGFYGELKKLNPACRIILTVSPVRHIKDTLELNSVSKSILRLTCHTLMETFQDVDYFPAYEIMIDDLRDYRFYKPDMIHPSNQAVDYIWEKFNDEYFNPATKEFIGRWDKIKNALQHKPYNSDSESHQKFLTETLERLNELKGVVDVTQEIEIVMKQLI